jgi:hypothetical protein
MQDLRHTLRWLWRIPQSGMRRYLLLTVFPRSPIHFTLSMEATCSSQEPHGATSQKTTFFTCDLIIGPPSSMDSWKSMRGFRMFECSPSDCKSMYVIVTSAVMLVISLHIYPFIIGILLYIISGRRHVTQFSLTRQGVLRLVLFGMIHGIISEGAV